MHDVLRQRVLRKLESLPEEKVYQVLDYIEFLESKYAPDQQVEASGLQKLAENLQDRMRKKAMNPETIREAFQLIAAADRVLSGVSTAGKQILDELTMPPEAGAPSKGGSTAGSPTRSGSTSARSSSSGGSGTGGGTNPAGSRTTRGASEPPPAPRVESQAEDDERPDSP